VGNLEQRLFQARIISWRQSSTAARHAWLITQRQHDLIRRSTRANFLKTSTQNCCLSASVFHLFCFCRSLQLSILVSTDDMYGGHEMLFLLPFKHTMRQTKSRCLAAISRSENCIKFSIVACFGRFSHRTISLLRHTTPCIDDVIVSDCDTIEIICFSCARLQYKQIVVYINCCFNI